VTSHTLRTNLPTAEILQLYLAGVSENDLAKRFQTSRGAIRRRLLRAGIVCRGRSQAELLKWSKMNPEARAHQVEPAHEAKRGTNEPRDKLWKVNPTESETYFISLVNKYKWPLAYCGSGGVVINGCNPDFIHKTQRKVLEVYTGVKHLKKGEQYAKAGYECLFLNMRQAERFIVEEIQQFLQSAP